MKNVLFIITDDQRHDALGAAGNKDILTPNLDRLAARGTMFTQAHIPGGTSGAVCMPSRAMLNTGRTLFSLEGEGGNIPAEHTTMAEVYKNAGFDTYVIGKWHNGTPAVTRGFCGGDNIFFGGMWDHWNVPVNRFDPTGEYDNVINFTANFFYDNKVVRFHCDKFNPGVHSSTLLTDTAIDYIKNKEDGKPFFLYLSYLAPHDPRTMPKEFLEMYDPDKIDLPANFLTEHPFEFGQQHERDELLAPMPRTEENTRKQLAEYYAMVTHLDYEVGRLLDELDSNGLAGDTLIVFTSDNGLGVGSHGLFGKQNLYDHSVRVPLILAGPDIPKGEMVDNYVYLLDIMPTLCDLCGLPIPESVEGKSFARMFEDKNYKTRETLYLAFTKYIRAVKDDRYKYIVYRNHADCVQLFDLADDPLEMRNLAEDDEYINVRKGLKTLLYTHRDEWRDGNHVFSKAFWG